MPSPTRNRANRKRRPITEREIESVVETAVEQPEIVQFYATREPPPGLERVGDILRRRRIDRGDDLQLIADYLCIRKSFLIALENSDYEDLPADAYVIGFLRSYATYLGFDGADAINRYRGEMSGRRRKPALVLPTPITEGRTPSAFIMIGAAAAAILIYAFCGMAFDRRPHRRKHTTTFALNRFVGSCRHSVANSKRHYCECSTAGRNQHVGSIATPTAPPPSVPITASAPAPMVPFPSTTAPPPTMPGPVSHITIRAEKESWVLVTDDKGKPVLDHVMKPGETFAVPDQEGAKLTTGNSGGITLLQDGKPMPKLSRDSSILHDVPLTDPAPKAATAKAKQ